MSPLSLCELTPFTHIHLLMLTLECTGDLHVLAIGKQRMEVIRAREGGGTGFLSVSSESLLSLVWCGLGMRLGHVEEHKDLQLNLCRESLQTASIWAKSHP